MIMFNKKLTIFLLCAFLPMVGIGLAVHFLGSTAPSGTPEGQNAILKFILSAGAMLVPMLAVIITQLTFKEPAFSESGISFKVNRWWAIGWIMMPIFSLAAMGMTLLMPGAEWTPDSKTLQLALASMPEGFGIWGFVGITIFSGMFAGITINAVFAFGEEIAWRGFLMQLFKGKKFLAPALWTGVIWGIWHAPLILNGHNYPQHPVAGVFMMVILCLLLTPILMYFRIKSRSVIVPAIMHSTMNAVAGLSMLLITPANDLLYGCPGLAGMTILLLINVCLFLYDRFISKENIWNGCI